MVPDDRAMEPDLVSWLALARVPGIGAVTFHRLLQRFGSPGRALAASDDDLRRCPGVGPALLAALRRPPDHHAINAELAWAEADGHHCLTLTDPRYPRLLAAIPAAPPVLYVSGDLDSLACPQLAVVGSRRASPDGLALATAFARELQACGLLVTSGLALGIDAAAHRGALQAGGRTIAVLGSGLARIYPRSHVRLAGRIAGQGALVSEFPLAMAPKAENFPRRNRLISGLSLGVLVVEASLRSGSLRTAAFAAEQGRELFAIPGSIHNPLARGCHHLLRQGAKLTETVADICTELGPLLASVAPAGKMPDTQIRSAGQGEDERRVYEQMGFAPIDMDVLVERCRLSVARISAALSLLELENQVISLPGGRYLRCN